MRKIYLLVVLCALFCSCGGQNKPFFFIQISDPQFGMIERNKGFSNETDLVERSIAAINRLKPDFVVVTGDMVNDPNNVEQLKEWKRLSATIDPDIKVFAVPGNHDVGNDAAPEMVEKYKSEYGYDRFSFSHKGVCFIGYNSPIIKADRKEAEEEQFEWLKKEFQNCVKGQRKVLFAHHPFYLQNPDEEDKYENISIDKRKKYLQLFDKYNVRTLFTGHLHKNSKVNGGMLTTHILTGLCRSFEGNPGFNVVKVYSDRIETEFYDVKTAPAKIKL
ncbi:metallophosphoesterase [Porphyromonadaceae bacterium]